MSLRRLLKWHSMHSQKSGGQYEPFLYKLTVACGRSWKAYYQVLEKRDFYPEKIIKSEEESLPTLFAD